MSVLIKGGRVVTAGDDVLADVLIEEGVVVAIGASLDVRAETAIDARGKYILPGAIDPHTHLDAPGLGTATCDDFTSGTVAAAFGGTTTIVDFCTQLPGQGFDAALADWHGRLQRNPPMVDVGVHMIVADLRSEGASLQDLARMPAEGVTSFKLFMAYKGVVMVDDETLFKTMLVAAETGAVVLVHAENGDVVDILQKRALAEGRTEPRWHAATRPPAVEGEATNRAIQLARLAGCPLYVVHVSCREALEPISAARTRGWDVWGETCTQYLFVDETALESPWHEAAKYVFTPPPRPKEHQDVLWRALANGELSVLSTDHAPFRLEGQKTLGRGDFSKIPNGAPGIEDRLHMLHHFGVRAGRISLSRLVDLTATSPAKIFGLYPRKGTIAVGSDADLVVWDPDKRVKLSAATHHSNVDYNLFEGTEVVGGPELVLVRGAVVIEHDELVGRPGHGQFLRRACFRERLEPVRRRERTVAQ